MTTSTLATPGATPASQRRTRGWVIGVSAVLLLVVIATYLIGRAGSSTRPYDPDNPGPGGLQAIAQVLQDQGVDVQVTRGVSNADDRAPSNATVLVVGTEYLSPQSGADVVRYAQDASMLVVLDPGPNLREALDVPIDVGFTATSTPISPECDLDLWAPGERISSASGLLTVDAGNEGAAVTTCLPPSPGYNLGGARSGYLVQIAAEGSRPPLRIAAIGDALVNGTITEQANAATGLRLLGSTDTLIWVVPGIGDAGEQPPSGLFDVLPPPVLPSMVLIVLSLVMLSLVAGRRFGRVATEPLPVIIHAIETTASRGRLYQDAKDRSRALASLQLAARRSIAVRLGLPSSATPEEVVAATAVATGGHTDELHHLLTDTTAVNDETLVRTARDLRALEDGISTL